MNSLDAIKGFEPSTDEGKKALAEANKYLESIHTPEQVMAELKAVGLFNENGEKNPYFYPEPTE